MYKLSRTLQQQTFNSWVDCNQRMHVQDITFDCGEKVEGQNRLTRKHIYYTDRQTKHDILILYGIINTSFFCTACPATVQSNTGTHGIYQHANFRNGL
jgi:hypothetical protein